MNKRAMVVLSALLLAQAAPADLWTYQGLGGGSIDTLAWASNRLYAGCHNGEVYAYYGSSNWIPTGLNADNVNIFGLQWGDDHLYAGSFLGRVYRRDGVDWTRLPDPGGGALYDLTWDGAALYAACADGAMYRYDGLSRWDNCGTATSGIVWSLFWNGSHVYAGCTEPKVLRYEGGGTWSNTGLNASGNISEMAWDGTNLYAAVGHGAYQYHAGSWTSVGDLGSVLGGLTWAATNLFVGAWNGHVYRRTGDTSWTVSGSLDAPVIKMAFDGERLFAGCNNGHVYRQAQGTNWSDTWPDGGRYVRTLAGDGTNLFAGTDNGFVYRLRGSAWEDTGLQSVAADFDVAAVIWTSNGLYAIANGFVYCFANTNWTSCGDAGLTYPCFGWDGDHLYVGGLAGQVVRYEGGTDWTDLGAAGAAKISAIAGLGTNLYATSVDGYVYRYLGEQSWTNIWPDNDAGNIQEMIAAGTNLYVAQYYDDAGKDIYKYDGTTWENIGSAWGDNQIDKLLWHGTNLYAGSSKGTVYRYDGGTNWTSLRSLGNAHITGLAGIGDHVYAGSGLGVFRGEDPVIAQYVGIFDFQQGTNSPNWSWLMTHAPFDQLNRMYIAFAMLKNGELSYNIGTNAPDSQAAIQEMEKIDALVAACRQANPKATILISSGYDDGSMYREAATNPARFAQSVLAFVRRHQLDGYDMDWENGIVGTDMNALLQATRTALQTNVNPLRTDGQYYLTLATWPTPGWRDYQDVPLMASYLDQVNIMSYGARDSAVEDATAWHNAGVPWNKIVVGVETENGYEGDNVDTLGPDGTIAQKCRYALTNGLAGAMAWRLDNDYREQNSAAYPPTFRGAQTMYIYMTGTGPLVHYVDAASTNPVAPFTSWATAATNIQDAVDVATNGALVLVTNGVYATGGDTNMGRVVVRTPLALRSVNGPAVTVIDGGGITRGLSLDEGVSVSGFTITNGYADSAFGGGIFCGGSAVISNCLITGNTAGSAGGGVYSGRVFNCELIGNRSLLEDGGGVAFAFASDCLIRANSVARWGGGAVNSDLRNCRLEYNVARERGGGAAWSSLSNCVLLGNSAFSGGGATVCTLYDCAILSNSAYFGGGAEYSQGARCLLQGNTASYAGGAGEGSLTNCVLRDNTAVYRGGGARLSTLYNCLLTGNATWQKDGGGSDDCTLYNCTVIDNTAYNGIGGGAFEGTLVNCIVYYNQARSGANYYDSVMTNCCVTPMPTNKSVGAITNEPWIVGFHNPRLLPGSPCYNAGTNRDWMAGATDLMGHPRIMDGIVDIGACEWGGLAAETGALTAVLSAPTTQAVQGVEVDFFAEINGPATGMAWDFGDGAISSHRFQVRHAWSAPGVYPVQLTAWNESGAVTGTVTMTVLAAGYSYYVAMDGNDTHSGSSWLEAKRTIQGALDIAAAGATIWVSNGVYDTGGRAVEGLSTTNRALVRLPLTLRSVNGPTVTVIDGAQTDRGVYLVDGATLIGFTLANGWALDGFGGGLYSQAHNVISNCVISGNRTLYGGGGVYGGEYWHCTLAGNTVSNGVDGNGGGAALATLYNCRIAGNWACSFGGGAYQCSLQQCVVEDNLTTYLGGGAFESVLYNSLILRNHAVDVAGGAHFGSLDNCVVAGNISDHTSGGVYNTVVRNCIIWSNNAPENPNWWASEPPIEFSCTTPLPPGAGNLTNDPLFVSAADLRLQAASPCINAGTNEGWTAGAADLAGNSRIIGPAVDMGAYEFPLAPTGLVAATAGAGGCLSVSWSGVSGSGGYAVYRSTSNVPPGQALANVTTNAYCDGSARPGQHYYYWVAASFPTGPGALSAAAIGWLRGTALPWLMLLLE